MNKTIPEGYCQCGCGQRTEIAHKSNTKYGWVKGKPRPYVSWHSKNNGEEDFWLQVDAASEEQCWEWQAGLNSEGYGSFWMRSKPHKAHRLAYELVHGEIPDGMFVCHSCDNPKCCNPAHLFLGTNKDNIEDKVSKGRQARGVRITLAKLTAAKVREIRELYATGKYSHRELGRIFGVDGSNITRAVNGQHWRHVA